MEENKKNDPIGRLCGRLLDDELLSHKAIEAIDAEAIAEVEDAVAFAESSPDPDPEELYTDIYYD